MHAEVLNRLIHGGSLDDLGLARKDGRLVLEGLTVPEPAVRKMTRTAIADVAELDVLVIKGATWKGLDFSGSRLNGLRFFDCIISDCVFDNCTCQDWRLWSTMVSNVNFQSADLRKSVLGGVQAGKRNIFANVDFTNADLRQTSYVAAEFVDCIFNDTRLDKVDFQTSAFTNCIFKGKLREVLFYRRGFKGEAFPANEMTDVDFTQSQLRWVEFRGLDMETVRFPKDNDHIIVESYPRVLERLEQAFKEEVSLSSKRLANFFAMDQKWAGAKQRRGVFNKNDLLEIGGEDGLRRVLEIIEETRAVG
jgi:uncharacterized protein YjbI with pentapeptide repeats